MKVASGNWAFGPNCVHVRESLRCKRCAYHFNGVRENTLYFIELSVVKLLATDKACGH